MDDKKIRAAYVVIPALSYTGGQEMIPSLNGGVTVKDNVTDVEEKIAKAANQYIEQYKEVHVFKLVKIVQRTTKFVDYPSGEATKTVQETPSQVIDDLEI